MAALITHGEVDVSAVGGQKTARVPTSWEMLTTPLGMTRWALLIASGSASAGSGGIKVSEAGGIARSSLIISSTVDGVVLVGGRVCLKTPLTSP